MRCQVQRKKIYTSLMSHTAQVLAQDLSRPHISRGYTTLGKHDFPSTIFPW